MNVKYRVVKLPTTSEFFEALGDYGRKKDSDPWSVPVLIQWVTQKNQRKGPNVEKK